MPTDERLQQWEEEHGVPGIFSASGRDINRKCACGKRTTSLSSPFCQTCATANRRLEVAMGVQGDVMETRPKPRRPPPADPDRYTRCKTPQCKRIAKHHGRLCPQCYVAGDPATRACPVCKKAPRACNRQSGVCSSCLRNIHRAATRLWTVAGGNMALACTALAQQGMEHDADASTQLLEALQMDKLTPEDMEGAVFDLES